MRDCGERSLKWDVLVLNTPTEIRTFKGVGLEGKLFNSILVI